MSVEAREDLVARRASGRDLPLAVGATGEIVLARHGQGDCNAAGVIGGARGCSGLSPRGRRESALLADRLAELHAERPFDALLASPRPRVLECARIVGARLAMPVTVVEALRGQEFGAADGGLWEHVIADFGGPPAHDPERPVAAGAEPWKVYADRVLTALTALLAEYAGRRLLVIGHGKTTGLAGALLAGADPPARAEDYVVSHGAFSHWRHGPDGWQLVVQNDTRDLVDNSRTSTPGPEEERPHPPG